MMGFKGKEKVAPFNDSDRNTSVFVEIFIQIFCKFNGTQRIKPKTATGTYDLINSI